MTLKASCGRWCGNVKIGGFRAAAMPTVLMQAPDIYFSFIFVSCARQGSQCVEQTHNM